MPQDKPIYNFTKKWGCAVYLIIPVVITILLLISCTASSQVKCDLSVRQAEVVQDMQVGDRLFKTMIGYQLVSTDTFEGQVLHDSRWIRKNTIKALIRKKWIKFDRKTYEYFLIRRCKNGFLGVG